MSNSPVSITPSERALLLIFAGHLIARQVQQGLGMSDQVADEATRVVDEFIAHFNRRADTLRAGLLQADLDDPHEGHDGHDGHDHALCGPAREV